MAIGNHLVENGCNALSYSETMKDDIVFSNPPPPYTMCSREECEARQASCEISLFERTKRHPDEPVAATTPSTSLGRALQNGQDPRPSSLQSSLRNSSLQTSMQSSSKPSSKAFSSKKKSSSHSYKIDPRLAVAKYRRSAAGVTDRDRAPPRTLDQLIATVQYLQHLLVSAPTISSDQSTQIGSWLQVVEFVQDRLRAVQVDLVITGQASKVLQYHMTRTYIFILYLVVDVEEYARTFGKDALQAAMASYWNDPVESPRYDDEMLSYALLLQCSHSEAAASSSLSFAELYRKHVHGSPTNSNGDNIEKNRRPLFQWALKFVVAWNLGHWHVALRQLDQGYGDPYFDVFARCCLAPFLPWMRWKTLEAYNLAWGKGEEVAATELARLLFLQRRSGEDNAISSKSTRVAASSDSVEPKAGSADAPTKAALALAAGLPVDDETRSKVRFKVSSLQPLDADKEKKIILRDDDFVCRYEEDGTSMKNVDRNGLSLPPQTWMRKLLLLDR
jgi:hypothetical protein